MRALRRKLGSLRREREDDDSGRTVEKVDAPAHMMSGVDYPPGYVKDYDEGRPPH